jgi:glycosyltransferase involved in cell wall biosynthesis
MSAAIRIISNIPGLSQVIDSGAPVVHEYIGDLKGGMGAIRFIRKCLASHIVILDDEPTRLVLACMLRYLLPLSRFRLVSVDLILRAPVSWRDRLRAFIGRILLKRVHRFILYFKDLRGYQVFYGIDPKRAVYVPFKVNNWEKLSTSQQGSSEGSYVLCAGRSLRDVKTFVEAMDRVRCPGVLLQQRSELLSKHGTEAWAGKLPANVRLITDESNKPETFLEFISRARIVVIPRFRNDVKASGIGTYLLAMALNKSVIISKGPGAEDVLTDQAVVVSPEDPDRLAREIEALWENDALRNALAGRGMTYARSLQGESRLLSDILRNSIAILDE